MKRSKFPYTARSTAKVIRHAVSIDERRAKFRQDLISEAKSSHPHADKKNPRVHPPNPNRMTNGTKPDPTSVDRFRRRSAFRPAQEANRQFSARMSTIEEDRLDPRRATIGAQARLRSSSPAVSQNVTSEIDGSSIHTTTSVNSYAAIPQPNDDEEEDEKAPQDIEELWFPGCHADLGGGWPLADGEESPLSHGPLVWMVREAQRAGLEFDGDKMLKFNVCDEDYNIPSLGISDNAPAPTSNIPDIEVTSSPTPNPEPRPDIFHSPRSEQREPGWAAGMAPQKPTESAFHKALTAAFTKGVLHDCLEFNNGLPHTSVISWKIMEYMPFRRMDLRPDGSWKAISIPLPMGETRDIPENAWIHHSAIRRMEANEHYRPGNLIIGGGGRGVRRAPKEMGIGEWEVHKGEGDLIGMVYRRKGPSAEKEMDKKEHEKDNSKQGKKDSRSQSTALNGNQNQVKKEESNDDDYIKGTADCKKHTRSVKEG